jgi:hypothetical protein
MGYMAQNQMTRDPVAQIENFKTQPENPNFPLHRPIFFSFLNSSSFFFFSRPHLLSTLPPHAVALIGHCLAARRLDGSTLV